MKLVTEILIQDDGKCIEVLQYLNADNIKYICHIYIVILYTAVHITLITRWAERVIIILNRYRQIYQHHTLLYPFHIY